MSTLANSDAISAWDAFCVVAFVIVACFLFRGVYHVVMIVRLTLPDSEELSEYRAFRWLFERHAVWSLRRQIRRSARAKVGFDEVPHL